MKAKLFNHSYENGLSTEEYCVEGKIHFTKRQFLSDRPYCLEFRRCNSSCQYNEYVVPDNVAKLVEYYCGNNFTGERFTANFGGEIEREPYAPCNKHELGEFDSWPSKIWELVE